MALETDLYEPIKSLLEEKGYEVKAEVNGCDVVAMKPDGSTVIVELKLIFSLDLILQGVNRLALTDAVYLAFAGPDTPAKRRNWKSRRKDARTLCKRLGLGLILVYPNRSRGRRAEVLLDPLPYQPRKNKRRQTRLMTEFTNRVGDPNIAGSTRVKIITAYRQDAIRIASVLNESAAMKVKDIRQQTEIERAGSILQANHYGWFNRIDRGIYELTDEGKAALKTFD